MGIVSILISTTLKPLVDSTLRQPIELSIQCLVTGQPVSGDSEFIGDKLFVHLFEVTFAKDFCNLVLDNFKGYSASDVVVQRMSVRDQVANDKSHSPVVNRHQFTNVLAAGANDMLGSDEVCLR